MRALRRFLVRLRHRHTAPARVVPHAPSRRRNAAPVAPPPATERIADDSHKHLHDIPRRAYSMEQLEQTSHLPRSIYCPITNMPMCDPVMLTDGFSYERDAIVQWFQYRVTSPFTGRPISNKTLVPNHALRGTIHELIHRDAAQTNE